MMGTMSQEEQARRVRIVEDGAKWMNGVTLISMGRLRVWWKGPFFICLDPEEWFSLYLGWLNIEWLAAGYKVRRLANKAGVPYFRHFINLWTLKRQIAAMNAGKDYPGRQP